MDDVFTNKDVPLNKLKNFEINEFAISLKGLSDKEKRKRIQGYKMQNFDFDSEDEILYSSCNAKANAGYICEIDELHSTFISKATDEKYVEVHHLIPFSKRKDFDVNIDIEENLIALCPNCHRKIHLSKDDEKTPLLDYLLKARRQKLADQTIQIDVYALYEMYNVNDDK